MAIYAIGDIQGCYDSLQRLLEKIEFTPGEDRLWLVGDLVNRGPRSLDVLRWASGLGESVVSVLGNHDLHLLGLAAGLRKVKRSDTLAQVLDAPDAGELIDWLRWRPFLHREGDFVLIHAGLHPTWSVSEAEELAREAEELLRADDWMARFAGIYSKHKGLSWSETLTGNAKIATAMRLFTKMRTLRGEHALFEEGYTGTPEEAPVGLIPWFSYEAPKRNGTCVVFGHWSTLGLRDEPRYLSLDTGCVWGGKLTAVRLPDRKAFQQNSVE